MKSPFLIDGDFLCSPDSVMILRRFASSRPIEVPAHIEVIGKDAFACVFSSSIIFASGSRLREIGEKAFAFSGGLREITLPSSVEILGDRCFENCRQLETVTFEEQSKLRKIGERAFASSGIKSFTIPASVNEMDGSAFLGCPLQVIDFGPGNRRLMVRESTLLTSDGREIVTSLRLEREICVVKEVEVLRKSCFESWQCLTALKFESESKLRKICRSALSGCESLRSIVVPASVTEIDEFAFKDCIGVEEFSIHKDTMLVRIGEEAFAGCSSLRSFYVPKKVEAIGENCFSMCPSLSRLKFGSGDTLGRIVRDGALDEALEHLGVTEITRLFRIEVDEDGSDLSFPGWISVADGSSHLTLRPDI
jgi:hypothetical protein